MVVTKGDDITAGSSFNRLAIMGREQPIILAKVTSTIRVRLITRSTFKVTPVIPSISRSTNSTLTKLMAARLLPQSRPTRSSFHITLKISRISISFRDRARITVTLA